MPRPCGQCARCVHLQTLIFYFPHDRRYRDVASTAKGCRSPVDSPLPTAQPANPPSPTPAQAQPADPHQPSPPSTPREPASSPPPPPAAQTPTPEPASEEPNRNPTPSPASFPLLTLSPPLPPLEMRDLPEPPELEDDSDGDDGLPMLTQIMSQIREPVRAGGWGKEQKERDMGKGKKADERLCEVKVKDEPEEEDDMYLDYPDEPDTQDPIHPSHSTNTSPSPSPHPSQNRDVEDDEEVDELLSSQPSPSPAKLPSSKQSKRKRSPSPGESEDDHRNDDDEDKHEDRVAKTSKRRRRSVSPAPRNSTSTSASTSRTATASGSTTPGTSVPPQSASAPTAKPRPAPKAMQRRAQRPLLAKESVKKSPAGTAGSASASKPRTSHPASSSSKGNPQRSSNPSTSKSGSHNEGNKGEKQKAESYKKHSAHWYLDGSVLVQVDGVRYKLHRVVDGRDWEVLVGALDGVVSYLTTPPPPSTLAAVLRASHALGVREFERWAGRAFGEVWSDEIGSLGSEFTGTGGVSKDTKGKGRENSRRRGRRRGPLGVSATEAVITGRLCNLPGVVKRGMWELGKSETFEQGSDGEGDKGSWASDGQVGVDGDEGESDDEDGGGGEDGMGAEGESGDEGGEDSDDAMSVIVIDSDIEMITPSSSRRRRTKSKPTSKSSQTQHKVNPALGPKAPKRNIGTMMKREKRKWTLPAKDFTRLTLARSRLVAVWMRESVQFPEELLRVGCPDAIANRPSHPSESVSHDDEVEQEDDAEGGVGRAGGRKTGGDDGGNWYTCTAADASAAREAHRRLVVQSGVQGMWVNDVMGGLEALKGLRWGWSPPSSTGLGSGASGSKSGSGSWSKFKGKERSKQDNKGGEEGEEEEEEEEEMYYGEFCDACVERMRERWERVRKEVWGGSVRGCLGFGGIE
ncbi:hypothetical protein FA13DRAFT_1802193 [Coprinellus micaceus]|uniref:Uncharacterized protein n=1 Tax=Coprinellus micaceus TaxID=71717 RepID=A0A4Y7SD40_COPMI|nr:hypothetical protein FA13DRAFT_1802193 [Coprinellus micaceus]